MPVLYLSLLMLADLCTESTCSRNSRITQSQKAVKHFVNMLSPLSVFLAISDGSKSSNTISNLNLQALIIACLMSTYALIDSNQDLRRKETQILNSPVCTATIIVYFSD